MRKRTLKSARARIYAIVNQKGGVGKTTTAVNLAAALALVGKRVLLLDMDAQGNATVGVGAREAAAAEGAKTIHDVLLNGASLRDVIVESCVDNLWVAPSSPEMTSIDLELATHKRRSYILRDMLGVGTLKGEIIHDYDYVIIDCPPSLSLLTFNAMAAADGVIAPLQCEYLALEGLAHLLKTIERVKEHLASPVVLSGVLLTMYDKRNNLARQVAEDARANLGGIVFETTIPRNVRLAEAPSHEMPALIYDRQCSGSQAYMQLAAELVARKSV